MTKLYNLKYLTKTRKFLRSQPVKAEWLMWSKLKRKQLGYKFRRQYSVGIYIIDFYCPELKLVVEADGATHSSSKEIVYDKNREEYLKKFGIKIKRYNNLEIFNNLEMVASDIKNYCDKIKIPPLNLPLVKGENKIYEK